MSIFAHIEKNELDKAPLVTAVNSTETIIEHSLETRSSSENHKRTYTDPRPDLEADSILWTKLLIKAEKINPNLAGTLHGFRCGGLRIKRGRTSYLLRPDLDPTGNLATWKDQDEYDYDKLMHLFQYRAEVKELMNNI